MKTAISISDGVFDEADRLAVSMGVSRSQLYATAVAQFIEMHRGDGVTEALNIVYAGRPAQLDGRLVEMQAATIATDDGW